MAKKPKSQKKGLDADAIVQKLLKIEAHLNISSKLGKLDRSQVDQGFAELSTLLLEGEIQLAEKEFKQALIRQEWRDYLIMYGGLLETFDAADLDLLKEIYELEDSRGDIQELRFKGFGAYYKRVWRSEFEKDIFSVRINRPRPKPKPGDRGGHTGK